MAIKVKRNKDVEEIYYDDLINDSILIKHKIARIYKDGRLLWEYANSNFFSKDNFVIVTKDNYIFNGKK